jgi:hypothetical protein
MQGNSHNRYELELLLVEDGPVNGEFTSHRLRCLGRMKFAFRDLLSGSRLLPSEPARAKFVCWAW